MFDKLLAIAGVTGVAVLGLAFAVGGCSSSDAVAASPPEDAGTDVKDSRPPPSGNGDPEACGPAGDPSTLEAMDAEFGWKPPPPRQNACTENDLTVIARVFNPKSAYDWVAGASAACQACVLSTKDSATWGPIVALDAEAKQWLRNTGACFAAVESSEDCGKAQAYLQACFEEACIGCYNQAERATCAAAAVREQCVALTAAVESKCTKPDSVAKCGELLDGIEYLCAYESPGGG